MIGHLWRGASGLWAQQRRLEMVAHDLANLNTSGYKRGRTGFADLVYRAIQEPGRPVGANPSPSLGSGIQPSIMEKDFAPGPLVFTGRDLDLAIEGEGFFLLLGSQGERLFTRNGRFYIDAEGRLVHVSGSYLDLPPLPQEGEKIAFLPSGQVKICRGQGEEVLGRLDLYMVPNPGGLEAVGDCLFRETPASGIALPGAPGEGGRGRIRSGYLEGPNLDLAEAFSEMILAQHLFEIAARTIKVSEEMWGLANALKR